MQSPRLRRNGMKPPCFNFLGSVGQPSMWVTSEGMATDLGDLKGISDCDVGLAPLSISATEAESPFSTSSPYETGLIERDL